MVDPGGEVYLLQQISQKFSLLNYGLLDPSGLSCLCHLHVVSNILQSDYPLLRQQTFRAFRRRRSCRRKKRRRRPKLYQGPMRLSLGGYQLAIMFDDFVGSESGRNGSLRRFRGSVYEPFRESKVAIGWESQRSWRWLALLRSISRFFTLMTRQTLATRRNPIMQGRFGS